MDNYDSLLLASGGMDSTVLAYWLLKQGKKILPLFIDYGQHFKETELTTLKKVLPDDLSNRIEIVRVSDIFRYSRSRMIIEPNLWVDNVEDDDFYLPYRNLLFLSIASSFAQTIGINEVYAAFINSNHAKEIDCSKEFFDKLGEILENYGTVKVKMPFRELTKQEIAQLGIELDVPIAVTYSCQANSMIHCGVCPNCIDRLNALNGA